MNWKDRFDSGFLIQSALCGGRVQVVSPRVNIGQNGTSAHPEDGTDGRKESERGGHDGVARSYACSRERQP